MFKKLLVIGIVCSAVSFVMSGVNNPYIPDPVVTNVFDAKNAEGRLNSVQMTKYLAAGASSAFLIDVSTVAMVDEIHLRIIAFSADNSYVAVYSSPTSVLSSGTKSTYGNMNQVYRNRYAYSVVYSSPNIGDDAEGTLVGSKVSIPSSSTVITQEYVLDSNISTATLCGNLRRTYIIKQYANGNNAGISNIIIQWYEVKQSTIALYL